VERRVWGGLLVVTSALLSGGGQPGLAGESSIERRFEITASRYQFDPARLEVEEGTQVTLSLRSTDTTHGFAIPALKVKVEIPKGGASVGVSFVASRVGRFPIECSEYCGTGHKRMRGELVVNGGSR